MLTTANLAEREALVLHLGPATRLSDAQFFDLCQQNRDLRFEQSATGDIIILSPAGGESSAGNAELTIQLGMWSKRDGTGVAFDSSAGFRLPNGATRSPDAAWILKSHLVSLSRSQKRGFIPLCPDFVAELRSPTDSLAVLQAKLDEYLANGARLGWLLDPEARTVYVYRPGQPVQRLDNPARVSGDPVLPGFVLDLHPIWEPGW
ncbi:MAG: Uma2 family endonuclease [Anaerolineae bacterium]|nr:Uma2 family endonuclease [Anaerolineae bacterium]